MITKQALGSTLFGMAIILRDKVDLLRKVDVQLRFKKTVLLLFKMNQHVNHLKEIHQRTET